MVGSDDAAALWSGVDRLVDRATGVAGLQAHGLHLLAARRWRARGLHVPEAVREAERRAALVTLAAPVVLSRAREAYDGRMALMKGLEVGARYPDPVLRPFRDLDLLVDDAPAAQAALRAAGFQPLGTDAGYDALHHLCPLIWPGAPVVVELHRRIEWPAWGHPPASATLLDAAVPTALGIDGVLALRPDHHAMALAAHSWSGAPLRRLLDVIDVAAVAVGLERTSLSRLADRWALGGVWESMEAAAAALVFERPGARLPRLWARDLRTVRDRTVVENHLARLVSPLSVLPPRRGLYVTASTVAEHVWPQRGPAGAEKRRRARRAVRHAFMQLSEHHALDGR